VEIGRLSQVRSAHNSVSTGFSGVHVGSVGGTHLVVYNYYKLEGAYEFKELFG